MTEHAKECFSDDTILMRNDGKTIKSIAIPQNNSSDEELTRHPTPTAPSPAEEKQDGFKTHIRCRWCDGLIKDAYIPKLKNGRNDEPYNIVFNYEPCPACREKWSTMVIFIEVTDKEPYTDCLPIDSDVRRIDGYIDPDENPKEYSERVVEERTEDDGQNMRPVQYERVFFYPTGRYTGVTLEAVRQYFTGDTSSIHNGSVIYLEQEPFERAFSDYFK